MKSLSLILLSFKLAVCKVDKNKPIPAWATSSAFFSITQTEEELSIVCPSEVVPAGVKCERGWIAYKVVGPLDFGLTGILASIAHPLAEAKVSLFAISTYDTDYVLVKEENRAASLSALKKADFTILEQ